MGISHATEQDEKYVLIIGGNCDTHELIRYIHSKKLKTIVVDKAPFTLAKNETDISINCSVRSVEQIISICKNFDIAGIYTAYGENSLIGAYEIALKLRLPFYASNRQIEIGTNKKVFKETCKQVGIGIVKEYTKKEAILELNRGNEIIVKPIDSAGGKGINRCSTTLELDRAISDALEHSNSKQYILEQYMNPYNVDNMHFHIHYAFANGKYKIQLIGDGCPFEFKKGKIISSAYIYPSIRQDFIINRDGPKFQKLFKMLNVDTGAMFLEGAMNKNETVYWECGYRLGASTIPTITRKINNADQCKVLLDYALNGTVKEELYNIDNENPHIGNNIVCNLLLFSKPGKILGFENIDTLYENDLILSFLPNCYSGEEIKNEDLNTYSQVVGRVFIMGNTHNEVLTKIKKIFETIELRGSGGENLLIESFDYDYFIDRYIRTS